MIRPPPPPPPPFSPPITPSACTNPWNSRYSDSIRILPPEPPPLVSAEAGAPFAEISNMNGMTKTNLILLEEELS